MEALAVKGVEMPVGGAAEPHRLFKHSVEYRGEVARRSVDGLQHLGGRDLSLQCLVTLRFALGKFSLTLGKVTLQIG
jgi:hypothetical protein